MSDFAFAKSFLLIPVLVLMTLSKNIFLITAAFLAQIKNSRNISMRIVENGLFFSHTSHLFLRSPHRWRC